MSVSKFKFVSPGVFIAEIDNSQVPANPAGVGPTIIGRFERGPSMRPVRISSLSELIDVFGSPISGKFGGDAWREGTQLLAPSYGYYAAQAWLRNTTAVNVVRLLGQQHSSYEAGGEAGWKLLNGNASTNGGVYGLFLVNSASTEQTGVLAATFYLQDGSAALLGKYAGTSTDVTASNALIQSRNPNKEFRMAIYSGSSGTGSYTFNFDSTSDKYIRNVFNTNPTLTNTTLLPSSKVKNYWLGETFDHAVEKYVTNTGTGEVYAFLTALGSTSTNASNFQFASRQAETGYIIGQDLSGDPNTFAPENMLKLFKIKALDSGEWESKNLKISFTDIKQSPNLIEAYGSFTLIVRSATDTDALPQVLERFTNLNLNPVSENYIARRIGDKFVQWDESERRLKEYGTYDNLSRYIYVTMESDVDSGLTDARLLPFGFYLPATYPKFTVSGSTSGSVTGNTLSFVRNNALKKDAGLNSNQLMHVHTSISPFFTASFLFPTINLRDSSSAENFSDTTRAYFGFDTTKISARQQVQRSFVDSLRYPASTAVATYVKDIFTLDNLSSSNNGFVYASGSRAAGTSYSAVYSYTGTLDQGYNKFTTPLWGGFDGIDITYPDPFANVKMNNSSTDRNNSVFYTIRRAVDTVADPEVVVTDIISAPGVTNTKITDQIINTCEARGDAMAIIDLPSVYTPEHENGQLAASARTSTVSTVVSDFKARAINSSYAATYYPWVQVRDTVNNQNVWVPPSVVALGALSYGQASQALWFAPAGFTRGGLSEGRGGIPVLAVSQRLTSKERDTLYDVNINPIAQFPAEGIVIFGQKTLQVTQSALDRINVRRLLIFLKREISIIASRLLFDQNVPSTWNRFKSQVEPLLASVKNRLGLSDYKLILDETTTTPDLVDRNIMYAKVLLKPAKALEFIAIDFVITNQGASFND